MSIRIAVITLMLLLALPCSQAQAGSHHWLAAGNGISLEAAVQQVKQQTGGRILTADTRVRNGNKVHRIKVLLPDGTVKVILINAE